MADSQVFLVLTKSFSNQPMLTVSLSGVRFHAPVGLYPQEKFLHNEIEIDLSVYRPADIGDLPLIDYTVLYDITAGAIAEPAELLETILQRIVTAIDHRYPGCKVRVGVRKLHPPMPGQIGYSEVRWES